MDERFIAVDKAVPATENIALKPPFHCVLAKHFHDAAVRRQFPAVGVFWEILAEPNLLADFKEGLELIGLRLVRPEYSEVFHVVSHHFSEEVTERGNTPRQGRAGFLDFDGEVAKVRHHQGPA